MINSESKGENVENPLIRLEQLERENQVLRAENSRLLAQTQTGDFHTEWLQEQLHLQAQQEASQLRFQTVFEGSQLGNKIIGSDLEILQVNQALVTLLGYATKEEIISTKILEYCHPDHKADWQLLQQKLWTEKIPSFSLDTCLIRRDGSSFHCRVTSILFEDNEQTLGYTILENIDERIRLEQKLHKLYEAQQRIVHLVAHDLKGPLQNIKGLTGLLLKSNERVETRDSERKGESLTFLNLISALCDKTFGILEDLLLIGELESATGPLPKEDTPMQAFIESVLAPWRIRAREKEVDLEWDFAPVPVVASIHRLKFARLLDNLLSNALKFSYAKGKIQVYIRQQAGTLCLEVKDYGMGIPQALQAHLFEQFTNAGREGTQGESTTGLGLYIAHQIVAQHQGTIWLESEENKGTTFFIELPAKP